MKNLKFTRFLLSAAIVSLFLTNALISRAQTPSNNAVDTPSVNKDQKLGSPVPIQSKSDRVFDEIRIEIVEDEACECAYVYTSTPSGIFPKAFLFGALGLPFLIVHFNSADNQLLPPPAAPQVISPS